MELSNITIAPCGTYHLNRKVALYAQRFHAVQKFHPPGVAPVIDATGAYHITQTGEPYYTERYTRSFGFYDERAAVTDQSGWFHIGLDGKPIYYQRYSWCGNFQEGFAPVRDNDNYYFHIDKKGQRIYADTYSYVGDFRDGIATVQKADGLYTHIKIDGQRLHDHWFFDLDVYHKNFARAKDQQGWFHINTAGQAIYPERYIMVEPFYNGLSRVQTDTGEMLRIDEQGYRVEQLSKPNVTAFQQLSGDLVGYWRTQTIKAAVELKIFEFLPATVTQLATRIGLNEMNTKRLLRALAELHLVMEREGYYHPTARGAYLQSSHPLSLAEAALHWAEEPYIAWRSLTTSLKENREGYHDIFHQPVFDWFDNHPEKLVNYHQAISSYARHDYEMLSEKIEVPVGATIMDAAGGQGILLDYVLRRHPSSRGILLERPALLAMVQADELSERINTAAFDLFEPWPEKADLILMSRVLHDWNDLQSKAILQHAVNALSPQGKLLVIEFLLDDSAAGGLLDMNMLVLTGGKERSLAEFIHLGKMASLAFKQKTTVNHYHILQFEKDTTDV